MPELDYMLSEPTEQEKELFLQELRDLLEKHSMYLEAIPYLQRKDIQSPWEYIGTFFLQKKTKVEKNNEPIAENKKPVETK